MKCIIILFLAVIGVSVCTNSEIVKARLESCPGCSLNRLAEVRQFAYNDITTYNNVEWKKISGAPPELVFLNDKDEEVERIPLSKLNRNECNDILKTRGFTKKATDEL